MPREVHARSAPQYDNKVHGQGASFIPKDDRTINTQLAKVEMIRPSSKKGDLVFRPWPCLDYNDPTKLAPGRASRDDLGQGHWIVHVPMVRYFGLQDQGCEPVSFIMYEPWAPNEVRNNNPASVLISAAYNAYNAGQFANGRAWNPLWNKRMVKPKGSQGGAELSKSTWGWFMQASVYLSGDKDYTKADRKLPLGEDPGDGLVVIQLPASANQLVKLLDKRKPAEARANDDTKPWLDFLYGDPVGIYDPATSTIKGGLIITCFKPSKGDEIPQRSSWNGEISTFSGYEFAVNNVYSPRANCKVGASMNAAQTAVIKDKVQFWFDDPDNANSKGLLRIATTEEQCLWIAKAFKTEPQLLQFCWADHPEFMTDEVKAVLNERRSGLVPGDTSETNTSAPASRPRRSQVDPTMNRMQPPAEEQLTEEPLTEEPLDGGLEADNQVDNDPFPGDEAGDPAADEMLDEVLAEDAALAAVAALADDAATADGTEEPVVGGEADLTADPFLDDADTFPGDAAGDAGTLDELDAEAAGDSAFAEEPPIDEAVADFTEENLESAPLADEAVASEPTAEEARMQASMAAARARSSQRISSPPTATQRPVAATQRPAAATQRPAAATAAPRTATKPVTATKPAAVTEPATVAAKPSTAAAKPGGTAPAKPAARTAPATKPAGTAAAKPKPAGPATVVRRTAGKK